MEKLEKCFEEGKKYFEKGEEKKALKKFETVYIHEGVDIFKNEDPKLFEFFNEKVLKNPNKKDKLVKDFIDILRFSDPETLKRVFDICKIDATYNGDNAFKFPMSVEKLKFFIERGLDPNKDCGSGFPAIVYQCHSKKNIELLKKCNADLDLAMKHNKECDKIRNICNLIDCGVELGDYNFPVEYWLEYGSNIDIIYIYKLSKIEIDKGLKITERMKKAVTKIGERFEFYRDDFNKEDVDEYSEALDGLYTIFGVTPVARKVKNDLSRKITVKSKTWQEQYTELWDMLVPGQGQAISVQGELIRIIGKISHEILDNGAINWDESFEKMLKSITKYISQGKDTNNKTINELVKEVNENSSEDVLYFLTESIVGWVIANPEQIKLENVEYDR